jgi:hypothetical protein
MLIAAGAPVDPRMADLEASETFQSVIVDALAGS